MSKRKAQTKNLLKPHLKPLQSTWQLFFLPAVLLFSAALYHQLFIQPGLRISMFPYLKNLDLGSFIIVAVLAFVIFNLKRLYFSPKFSRQKIDSILQNKPNATREDILRKLFNYWRSKLLIIWSLGFSIIAVGVLFYFLTYSSDRTMLSYFVIGAFSLFLNYPRQEWFDDTMWQIESAIKSRDNSVEI